MMNNIPKFLKEKYFLQMLLHQILHCQIHATSIPSMVPREVWTVAIQWLTKKAALNHSTGQFDSDDYSEQEGIRETV